MEQTAKIYCEGCLDDRWCKPNGDCVECERLITVFPKAHMQPKVTAQTGTLIRIYTEDVPANRELVLAVLDATFPAYSVLSGIGAWRGTREKSLCIEIYDANVELAKAVASQIKQINGQEVVMVAELPTTVHFV